MLWKKIHFSLGVRDHACYSYVWINSYVSVCLFVCFLQLELLSYCMTSDPIKPMPHC
jgi:hypothetical protein